MVSWKKASLIAGLSILSFIGEADIEAYENDDFDDEEAPDFKRKSQLKQDR